MILNNEFFGTLTKTYFNRYKTISIINFIGVQNEIELTFEIFDDDDLQYFAEEGLSEQCSNEILFQEYSLMYQSFLKNLDKITSEILQAIMEYQNEHYYDTTYNSSFKYFENEKDVIQNVELLQIDFQIEVCGIIEDSKIYQEMVKDTDEELKCMVLIFHAEWVSDDYKLLSVVIANEKVIYVTEAYI